MPTSGTTTFNLDLNDAVEEAFERCGAELRTGYDLRSARRWWSAKRALLGSLGR